MWVLWGVLGGPVTKGCCPVEVPSPPATSLLPAEGVVPCVLPAQAAYEVVQGAVAATPPGLPSGSTCRAPRGHSEAHCRGDLRSLWGCGVGSRSPKGLSILESSFVKHPKHKALALVGSEGRSG